MSGLSYTMQSSCNMWSDMLGIPHDTLLPCPDTRHAKLSAGRSSACATLLVVVCRAFNYSYMIPLHPTKPSLPPQHQQQPCSHIRAPTILPAQQSSQTPVTAPAPSVVKSIRMTLPHTPPTANLQEDINASKKRLLSHSMLLRRLQQLGNSLAEAARLGHLQRMHFILQLLSSCPVSAHLLASSHVAVTPRHVLKQLQQQHDRPCQQQMQPMQHTLLQEQLRQQVAQTAQQLLQQWRAVLVSEVTSADKPRLLQARKVQTGDYGVAM